MKLVSGRPTDQPTDRPTDQPTDIATYRAAIAAKKYIISQLSAEENIR